MKVAISVPDPLFRDAEAVPPEMNVKTLMENIILLCGHYKGVDERVREHFTSEIKVAPGLRERISRAKMIINLSP